MWVALAQEVNRSGLLEQVGENIHFWPHDIIYTYTCTINDSASREVDK
jgi:hypothetical protein